MGSSFHSLYYHLVFHTKHNQPLIDAEWRKRLHAYIGGCVRREKGVAIAVGGVEDHVHILVRLHPAHRVTDLMRDVKRLSSRWVHREIGLPRFGWQDGYGAFSVSRYNVKVVSRYVLNQEEHHRRRTSKEELNAMRRRSEADSGIGPTVRTA